MSEGNPLAAYVNPFITLAEVPKEVLSIGDDENAFLGMEV
jgi:hypothetical protein